MQAGVATDIWKQSIGDYLDSTKKLLVSMERVGFDPSEAIPIDEDGELLNGSHRVACALALEIDEVPVIACPDKAWAPAWGADWFLAHGMGEGAIASLEALLKR